jgi:hypothetical protein
MPGCLPENALIDRIVKNVRSTRDLRAAIVSVAMELRKDQKGRLYIRNAELSEKKIEEEWQRTRAVLDRKFRGDNSSYQIAEEPPDDGWVVDPHRYINLERPNHRYEIRRLLINSALLKKPTLPVGKVIAFIAEMASSQRATAMCLERVYRRKYLLPSSRLHSRIRTSSCIDGKSMTDPGYWERRCAPVRISCRRAASRSRTAASLAPKSPLHSTKRRWCRTSQPNALSSMAIQSPTLARNTCRMICW